MGFSITMPNNNQDEITRKRENGQKEVFKWLGRYTVEYSILQNNFQELTYALLSSEHGVSEDITKSFMTRTTMSQLAETFWCICNLKAQELNEVDENLVSRICSYGNKLCVSAMEERNNFFHGVLIENWDDQQPEDPMKYKLIRKRIKTKTLSLTYQDIEFDSYYLKDKSLRVHNLARLVHDLGVGIIDHAIPDNVLSKKFVISGSDINYLSAREKLGETI